MNANTAAVRNVAINKMRLHIQQIREDREELGRVRRLCTLDHRYAGWSIDAVDSGKFQTPTTASQAKVLGGMHRIKNKITGVDVWGQGLYLFRTLPTIKTGANLTMTIAARLFSLGVVRDAEHLFINWDGASDNVAYTSMYGLAHLLVCAEATGWLLHTITIYRLQVRRLSLAAPHTTFSLPTPHPLGRSYTRED